MTNNRKPIGMITDKTIDRLKQSIIFPDDPNESPRFFVVITKKDVWDKGKAWDNTGLGGILGSGLLPDETGEYMLGFSQSKEPERCHASRMEAQIQL